VDAPATTAGGLTVTSVTPLNTYTYVDVDYPLTLDNSGMEIVVSAVDANSSITNVSGECYLTVEYGN
jgi:hypothetical protein